MGYHHRPEKKDQADEFVAKFSDAELMELFRFLWNNFSDIEVAEPKAFHTINELLSQASVQQIRFSFPHKEIFKLLNFILFGEISSVVYYDRVTAETDRLKAMVKADELEVRQLPPEKTLHLRAPLQRQELHYTRFPEGLKVSNPGLSKKADVTFHAWEQFCKRYVKACLVGQRAPSSQAYFIWKLKECFNRAKSDKLTRGFATQRLIKHQMRPVHYLKDHGSGLTFVVSDDSRDIPVIITVDPVR